MFLHIFVFHTLTPCTSTAFWTYGWETGTAPVQLVPRVMAILAALFLVHTFALNRLRTAPWETLFQGALIGAWLVVCLTQWASLFPRTLPEPIVRVLTTDNAYYYVPEIVEPYYEGEPPPEYPSFKGPFFRLPDSPHKGELYAVRSCALEEQRMIQAYWAYWANYDPYEPEDIGAP